jgi:NTP pyrophosphatase (non-canonical NTP hydrolase)
MAQFRNISPAQVQTQLLKDMMGVRADIEVGNLPTYETFVNNLMKTMATPAEELHHAGTGIAGEGGEILDATKKVWVYRKELDIMHLIEELGDLRFYYQAMLNLLGITDEQVRAQNMKKLRVRYADGKYSDAQANARADKALSADGSKGDGAPTARRFMGQSAPAPVDANGSPININDVFDRHMNESLRQLKRDEQP